MPRKDVTIKLPVTEAPKAIRIVSPDWDGEQRGSARLENGRVTVTLPSLDAYAVALLDYDRLPEVKLSSSFGEFSSKCTTRGDSALVFTRELTIRDYEISPERYVEYRNFFVSIVKSDRGQVVLVSKKSKR